MFAQAALGLQPTLNLSASKVDFLNSTRTLNLSDSVKRMLWSLCVLAFSAALIYSSIRMKTDDVSLNLTLPLWAEPLDPHVIEDAYSYFLTQNLYRSLFRYLPDGKINLDLAQDFKVSDDGLRIQISLKPGVTFSDGSPLVAKNVVASLRRIFVKSASIKSDLFYFDMENFVREIDSTTIEIRLRQKTDYWMKQLAMPDACVLPIDNENQPLPTNIFSGPYHAVVGSNEITLAKWRSDPFDSPNPPRTIKIRRSAEADPQVDDWLMYERSASKEKDALSMGWHRFVCESTLQNFLLVNPNTTDRRDRDKIFSVVQAWKARAVDPRIRPANGIFPYLFGGLYIDRAQESDKVDSSGPLKEIELEYDGDSELMQKIAHSLVLEFEQASISLKLKPLSTADYLDHLFGKKAKFILGRKAFDYYDPLSGLTYFRSDSAANYFYFDDKQFDKNIEETISVDNDLRTKKFRELEKKVLDQHIFIPLAWGTDCLGLWNKAKVRSVPAAPLGVHSIPLEMIEIR